MNKNRLNFLFITALGAVLIAVPAFGMDIQLIQQLEQEMQNAVNFTQTLVDKGICQVTDLQNCQLLLNDNAGQIKNLMEQATVATSEVPQPRITNTGSYKCARPKCPFEANKEEEVILHDYSVH